VNHALRYKQQHNTVQKLMINNESSYFIYIYEIFNDFISMQFFVVRPISTFSDEYMTA